jgi:iron complex outermembrane receptor protein
MKQKKRSMRRTRHAALSLALIVSASASAQQATDATIQDVVVTAPLTTDAFSQEQATAYQSTPQAVTVVTKQQIDALQINNLRDAQRLEPSLQIRFADLRNLTVNVRGFGAATSVATDGIFGGTPIYIDGVYQPRPGQAIFDMPDLVGVEVLKGPQATSGGMDNTGGVVRLTTALPSFTPENKLEFDYGSYNYVVFKGSATGPIADSDKAAFRLSFFSSDRNGYIYSYSGDQRYNDWHDKGIRAQVLLEPNSDLTARITFDYSNVNQACCLNLLNGVVTNYANGAAVSNGFFARVARLNYTPPTLYAIQTYKTDADGYIQNESASYGAAALIDYNINGFTLNSISSIRGWNFYPDNQSSGGIQPLRTTTNGDQTIAEKSVEQEIKVSTPKGGAVEATGGVFYLYEQLYDWGLTTYGPAAGAWYGSASKPLWLNNVALNYLGVKSYDNPTSNIIAPFVHAVWHATPEFDVTAGLRYSYSAKTSLFRHYQFTANSLDGLNASQQASAIAMRTGLIGANNQFTASTTQGLVSALASASYKFTPDVMGYVTYARGGQAGGPNPVSNLPAGASTTVKAEELDNYEVGVKSDLFEHRLLTNVAAFVMVANNYITNATNTLGTAPVTYLANAKRAISRGVELDVRAQPFEGMNVYGSATYDDTFYDSFNNAPCSFELTNQAPCSLTGKPLSLTPRGALAVGGEYTHHLGALLAPIQKPVLGYIGADFTYQTEYYSVPDDSVYSAIKPYGLLNLHAGLRFEDSSWDLSAWVHNALDKRYFTTLSPNFFAGGVIGTLSDPFMAGVTLKVRL